MNGLAVILALLLLIPEGPAHPDDGRRNPFAHAHRPVASGVLDATTPGTSSASVQVRAILLAGEQSLVSIDGTLLGIGETYRGLVLQSVREDAAVFIRDGDRLIVPLYEQRDSDEES